MSDPALRCPGCGVPAAADTVACDYCGSALATVTCPACFAPMFAGSRFCASCGAENGKPVGPLDRIALEQRVRDDKLRADTLVWRDGMATWAPASQVPEMVDVLKGGTAG